MTDKPNYSLKDLLNELKEKERLRERWKQHIQIMGNNIRPEFSMKTNTVLLAEVEAEISALKKGIKACEEILNSQELNSISPNEQKKMQQAENRIEPRGLLEGDSVDKTAVPDTQTNCPLGETIEDFNLNNTSTNLNLNKLKAVKKCQ
jgi:hypothetical protein